MLESTFLSRRNTGETDWSQPTPCAVWQVPQYSLPSSLSGKIVLPPAVGICTLLLGLTPTGCPWDLSRHAMRESSMKPSWQEKHMRGVLDTSWRPLSVSGLGS